MFPNYFVMMGGGGGGFSELCVSKIHWQWKICQFPSLHKQSCPGFSVSFRWKLHVSSVVLLLYYCVMLLQKQRAVFLFF